MKKTFASHLYRCLVSRGFTAFLDREVLQVGQTLTSQIQHAIRNASVHVAIFSERYAESSWCLKELILMLETGKPIIPLFYHVSPCDLRWTQDAKYKYTQALRDLEMKTTYDSQTREEKPRYNSTTIQNWRDALSSVADICGLDLDAEFNGEEGKLIDKIVELVLKLLKKPLYAAKSPTGLDEKVRDFEATVIRKQHNGIVGIAGLDGVGKTTLATEFFNKKRSNYSRSYFLSDVREKAGRSPLQNSLQSQVLNGLFQLELYINNSHQGIKMLRKHLLSTQVLLVLDDVDHVNQVTAILPYKATLHPGSLILITSRNKYVLERSGVKESSIYRLTGLNPQHSRELFCLHAFRSPQPLPNFEYLVDRFLRVCNELPLFLKLFGALLYGNNEIYWENQLHRLQNLSPGHIKQRLKICYEALNKEEQNMFLDIVCFFRGHGSDWTIRIMNASGWQGSFGLQNLQEKCLLEVDSKNDIRIHDHIRDLGREIVVEGSTQFPFCLRPWADEYIESSLISEVRGIRLSPSEFGCSKILWYRGILHLKYTPDLLERILRTVQRHSRTLVWLSWFDCPYPSLPTSFPTENLRVLYVGGKELKTLWQCDSQAPLQLRQLEINAPLCNIPKSIGRLKHIEHIRVVYSEGGKLLPVPILTLPEEVCYLRSLNILMLRGCWKMKSLPYSLGNLTNLESIVLDFCQSLERLPKSFGNLINLKNLNLHGCRNLTLSTETLGKISALEYLRLSNCSKIEDLPPQVANQRCLEFLDLSRTNLRSLPSVIGKLSNLKYLTIQSCNYLEEIGALPNALIDLDLSGCSKLSKIDESLCNLQKLQMLNIGGCKSLEELPIIETLVSLEKLWASGCVKLKSIRGLASLTKLQILNVSGCLEIEELPGVEHLRRLEKLDASQCPKLQWAYGVLERLRQQLMESMLII